jgi:hypothetical protein
VTLHTMQVLLSISVKREKASPLRLSWGEAGRKWLSQRQITCADRKRTA